MVYLRYVGLKPVVVHGGGPQVTRAMSAAGITHKFVCEQRVTDVDSIDMVREVLIGSLNSEIVSRLCGAGLQAVYASPLKRSVQTAMHTSAR